MKSPQKLIVFIITSSLSLPLLAGDLNSSNGPNDHTMYTLKDICNRLDDGTAGSPSAFTEPTASPSSTGCTLNEVMDKAPAKNTDGAAPSDVATDKKYWGLTDSQWGLQTGTGIPRFTDHGNGTVTDNLTGLIWLKNANCNNGKKNWTEALNFANTLFDGSSSHNGGDCGLSDSSSAGDWRLPNIKELQSLIDYSQVSPTLSSGHPFSGVESSYYGSSTSGAGGTSDTSWYVGLDGGSVGVGGKTYARYVWPVRAGQ